LAKHSTKKDFIEFGLRLDVIRHLCYTKNTMVYANASMIFCGLTPLLAKHVGKKALSVFGPSLCVNWFLAQVEK
jgi:hypothetical protein